MAKIYGALEVAQLEWFTQSPDTRPSAASNTYRVIYASDVKQVQISDGTNWIAFINGSTNQTLAGNITFSGEQIFTGLHRLSVTTDSSSTGAITALNNTTPVIEFTAAVTSISGVANSASGATVMLVNRTGGTVAVLDEDTGATAANRIRTGTGAQISLANNASILLTYVGDSRWHVIGGSGSGSGSAGINYITNGSAEADTLGWATYAESDAVTLQNTGDTVTLNSHGLSNGNEVSFTSFNIANGLSTNTLYYVVTATTNTFQVATSSGGSAVAITADSTGTLVRFVPKTAAGGSANVTITRSTTTPLIGTASFILTKDAANREGQGWEFDFTIDRAYQAKVLQVSFQYLVNSGTFVAGSSSTVSDVTVYIYDVTNAQIIQPSSFKLLSNNASISDTFNATFQTASNSTSYRLIFHVSTPSTAAYSLKVDGISVSPSTYVYGTPVTDWQNFTPTGSWTGAVTYTGQWRRVGDTLQMQGKITLSGAPTGGGLTVNLPLGLSIDTTKIDSTTPNNWVLGLWSGLDNGIQGYTGMVAYSSSTSVAMSVGNAAQTYLRIDGVSTTIPFSWNNTDFLHYSFQVPIAGWSSSVQTSDQTDTRVVSLAATGTVPTITGGSPLIYPTVLFDTHGAYNAATGRYTIPVSGFYRVTATLASTHALYSSFQIRKNTVAQTPAQGSADVNGYIDAVFLQQFNSGDIIDVVSSSNAASTSIKTSLTIERLSGPSAIAASESINAAYWVSANFAASTTVPINFDAREFDSHGAVTTSATAWRFTAPISGTYFINAYWYLTASAASLAVYKNGTLNKFISFSNFGALTGTGSTLIKLNAGDYIDLRPDAARTITGGSLNAVNVSQIQISRIGN